jgi:hypothetical protein
MHAWHKNGNHRPNSRSTAFRDFTSTGANRRAIGLVPVASEDKLQIEHGNSRYHEWLVSLEGKQSTCCLRIVCPRTKSRSAVLIFRGRVIGCIYGSKKSVQQYAGKEAYLRAVSDLDMPEIAVDAYVLDESLVLAAASLFHGAVMQPPPDLNAQSTYEWCIERLMISHLPGCIAINDSQGAPICMTYLFAGKIVGVYSFRDGWVSSTFEAGLKLIIGMPGTSVRGNMLDVASAEEALQLTFALTGLADRELDKRWSQGILSDPPVNEDIHEEADKISAQIQKIRRLRAQFATVDSMQVDMS